MKNAETREIIATYCDVCGKDITNTNSTHDNNKDFCMSTYHNILDKQVRCIDVYKIKLQLGINHVR